jgi:tetratricopeptide (TPR) repeat protein
MAAGGAMNPITRLFPWLGSAGRLRRRARNTRDASERAELLLRAAELDDTAGARLEAAVALAQAGRLAESAECWRRAIRLDPVRIPAEVQIAGLIPVLPQVASEVLDGLSRGNPRSRKHWKLERRGSFDGEERWRLEQEAHDTMDALRPTLRYIALAVAHTSAAPGRLRIDCDCLTRDSEAYLPIEQLGEAVITWDEARRITDARVQG